jgi:hypothetical protein
VPFAQEPEEESVFIFEEEIGLDFKTEIRKTSCTKRVR